MTEYVDIVATFRIKVKDGMTPEEAMERFKSDESVQRASVPEEIIYNLATIMDYVVSSKLDVKYGGTNADI